MIVTPPKPPETLSNTASPSAPPTATIDVTVPTISAWSYPVVIGVDLADTVRQAAYSGGLADLRP